MVPLLSRVSLTVTRRWTVKWQIWLIPRGQTARTSCCPESLSLRELPPSDLGADKKTNGKACPAHDDFVHFYFESL